MTSRTRRTVTGAHVHKEHFEKLSGSQRFSHADRYERMVEAFTGKKLDPPAPKEPRKVTIRKFSWEALSK